MAPAGASPVSIVPCWRPL